MLAGRKTGYAGDAIEDLRGFGNWRVLLLAFVGCVRSWQWVGVRCRVCRGGSPIAGFRGGERSRLGARVGCGT